MFSLIHLSEVLGRAKRASEYDENKNGSSAILLKKKEKNRNEPPCQYVVLPALSRCKATVFPYKQVCRPNTSLTSLSLSETLHTDMGKTSALSSLENHYADQNSTECFLVSKANEFFPSF